MDKELEDTFAELRFSSRVSLAMILTAAVLLIGSVLYSATRLRPLEKDLNEKKMSVHRLESEIERQTNEKEQLNAQVADLHQQFQQQKEIVDTLNKQVIDLKAAQNDLFDFLSQVTERGQVRLIDAAVDWDATKHEIMALPRGKRKQTVLTAILLAWKEIPFAMGQQTVTQGFDSPRFIRFVLHRNGVDVPERSNERLSDILMTTFSKVDTPLPGDLVFYKGQVGSFGLIYVAKGGNRGAGVGIGTLQASAPLQVISLKNVNTSAYPLTGYFRVNYPDEKM